MWFLPFVAPICLYCAYTDLRSMRIYNHAVIALFAVYVVVGPLALPFDDYLWRFAHMGFVLVAGILLNAGGALGAGDAKFAAAAAPFVALADTALMAILFSATLLAAVATHRLAMISPLRKLAPDWRSWSAGKKFPMGLALGGTLTLYLALAAVAGR